MRAGSRREPLRAALALGAAALAALLLLHAADRAWRPGIERNFREREIAQVRSVLGAGAGEVRRLDDPALLDALAAAGADPAAWALVAGGSRAAAAVAVTAPDGYSGPIRLVIGFDSGLTITAVRALEHSETPGIGGFVSDAAHPWMAGLAGSGERGRYDAVAGATVTSDAVTAAVAAVRAAVARMPRDSLLGTSK